MPDAVNVSPLGGEQRADGAAQKLLVIDTTYTMEAIKIRGIEDSVTCRDLDGFFSHVWSVHPVATLTTSKEWTAPVGKPVHYGLNDRHTFVEGKIGRFPKLRRLFVPNFLLAQMGLMWWLFRLIRRERIAVIRAGDPLYTGLISWALARLTGIPFVVRVGGNHDKFYEETGQPMMPRLFRRRSVEKRVERFVFRRADLVAGANQDNLNFALANGAVPNRATVFRYGNLIDRRHFVEPERRDGGADACARLGVEPGGFLLYIGRLEPVKRPQDVVRVLGHLHGQGHKLKALFLGDGTMKGEMAALGEELGVGADMIFAGSVDQGILAELIPQCAAVVSPHTGRALSEAALGGASIAAYDIDWQGELIKSQVTGELVPYGDSSALAEATARFVSDKAYADRMGAAARAAALEMLDPDMLDEHERSMYRKLLAKNR